MKIDCGNIKRYLKLFDALKSRDIVQHIKHLHIRTWRWDEIKETPSDSDENDHNIPGFEWAFEILNLNDT